MRPVTCNSAISPNNLDKGDDLGVASQSRIAMSDRRLRRIFVAFCVFYVLLAALVMMTFAWHDDEGFYLYATRSVAHGRMPYLDFFHNQPPLFVLSLGSLVWLAGASFSTIIGLKTVMLVSSLIGIWLGWRTLRLTGQAWAAICFVVLLGLCIPFVYSQVIVKSYALTFLCMSLAVYVMHVHRATWKSALIVGLLCGIATMLRLTFLVAVGGCGLYYLLRVGGFAGLRLAMISGVSCVATIVVVLLPFLAKSADRVWFNVYAVNVMGNADVMEIDSTRQASITYFIHGLESFTEKVERDYGVIIALMIVGGMFILGRFFFATRAEGFRRGVTNVGRDYALEIATAVCGGLVLAMHLRRPEPYNEYFAYSIPLFAFAAAGLLGRFIGASKSPYVGWGIVAFLTVNGLQAAAFEIRRNANLDGGRIEIQRVHEIITKVRSLARPDSLMLGSQAVAFGADLNLIPGAEYPTSASYLSDAEALRLHRLNPTLFRAAMHNTDLDIIVTRADLAKDDQRPEVLHPDWQMFTFTAVGISSGPANWLVLVAPAQRDVTR